MEQHREARGLPALDVLRQDLRFTLRTLRRDPALAFIVTLVLALGVGANVAVFSVVNTILLRQLPLRDPNQLVWFADQRRQGRPLGPDLHGRRVRRVPTSQPVVPGSDQLSDLFQLDSIQADGRGRSAADRRRSSRGELLPIAGREALRWADFSRPMSAARAAAAAALLELSVLATSVWRRPFHRGADDHHQRLTRRHHRASHRGRRSSCVFRFRLGLFSGNAAWIFFVPAYMDFWRTWGNTLAVIGRLKPGVSLAQAQAEADILFPQLKAAHQDWFSDYKSTLFGLQDRVSGKLRRSLYRPLVRGRADAADRLHQCVEPVAGARHVRGARNLPCARRWAPDAAG